MTRFLTKRQGLKTIVVKLYQLCTGSRQRQDFWKRERSPTSPLSLKVCKQLN